MKFSELLAKLTWRRNEPPDFIAIMVIARQVEANRVAIEKLRAEYAADQHAILPWGITETPRSEANEE